MRNLVKMSANNVQTASNSTGKQGVYTTRSSEMKSNFNKKVKRVTAQLSESKHSLDTLVRSFCRRNPQKVDDALALGTLEGVGVRVRDDYGTRKVDMCSNNCNNVDITEKGDAQKNSEHKATKSSEGDERALNIDAHNETDAPIKPETVKKDTEIRNVKKDGNVKEKKKRGTTEVDNRDELSDNNSLEDNEEYQMLKAQHEGHKLFVRKVSRVSIFPLLFSDIYLLNNEVISDKTSACAR